MNLHGLKYRQKLLVVWAINTHGLLAACENSCDHFVIAAELSPKFTKSFKKNIIPGCVPKANLLIYAPGSHRFSWVSCEEWMWRQSMDLSDLFPGQARTEVARRYSYRQIVKYMGNAFQLRCAAGFLFGLMLMSRFHNLADRKEQ